MAREITLTQDKITIVDDEDFEWLNQWKWYAANHKSNDKDYWYARRQWMETKKHLTMARVSLGVEEGKLIADHRNGETLDNRRSNLRIATAVQNQQNQHIRRGGKSQYKGVSKDGQTTWMSTIRHEGKLIYLGRYVIEISAAIAYDEKAKELFGEFARLNFP